jgi:hypothetical protein
MTITPRQEAIGIAWEIALAGRDPADISIRELLPAIRAPVPGATDPEIVEALRACARSFFQEADDLEAEGKKH